MASKVKFFLLLLAGMAAFSFAQESPVSVKKSVPAVVKDSLPWFAVREITEFNPPFTRNHLAQLTEKKNRIALVYFATWCLPCRVGIKKLNENSALLEQNNVKVVLVNIGERDEKKIQEWIAKLGVEKFKAISDPFKRLTEGFGLIKEGEEMSLPQTMVVDKNLKPLFMIGQEGNDWPQVLWSK